MSDLTPLDGVRSEHFLNGEDIKPITRREHFYAGQESKLPEGHQKPETREEWFIKKFRGGGGSSVTVEALTVTDNGTYSEEGKAYSPVTVNVDKGLEIVDLDKSDIVTFSEGLALPITSGKFYINAQQDLNGYDKPWVGGGGKNKFDSDVLLTASGWTKSNGVYSGSNNQLYATFRNGVPNLTFEENTQYTFSFTLTSQDETKDTYVAFKYQDETSKTIRLTTNGNYVLTSDSGKSVDALTFSYGNSVSISLSYLQLEEGTSKTTYEPYSNVRPITGFSSMDVVACGINIWDEEWEVGDINSNGVPTSSNDRIRSKNFIPVKPNTTYYLKCPTINARIITYDRNKNFVEYYSDGINNRTFTVGSNVYYIKFYMFPSYGTTYNNDISINYPSTDTSYHAYNGHTYSTTFNDTVYGGYYDSVNGKLVVDRAYADMGTLTWGKNQTYWYTTSLVNNMKVYGYNEIPTLICSNYKTIKPSDVVNGREVGISNYESSLGGLMVYTGDLENSPTGQLVYELATPIEIDVSSICISTIEGTNNIYHNCNGETEVSVIKEA